MLHRQAQCAVYDLSNVFEEDLCHSLAERDWEHVVQIINQGVDVEDLEEMTAIVHDANCKPKHRSRRNAAVHDIGQKMRKTRVHGAQDDTSFERRQCWSMWHTKEGRVAV